MQRIVCTVFIIYLSLFLGFPLCAQNPFINLTEQGNFLIGTDNLSQKYPPLTEATPPSQIQIYQLPQDYPEPTVLYGKSFSLFITNGYLMNKYWEQRRSFAARAAQLQVDRKVFKMLYNKPKVDEKKLIRQEWEETLGVDVWLPYYKAKEVEHWVKERISFRVFKLKASPIIEKNRFAYVFKRTF
ncbi:MAG: hypothetical protein ACM3IL_03820 [Deltaproteobacteria bacterium]